MPERAVLEQVLAAAEAEHDRLCPRQVLGARMGLVAAERLLGELDGPGTSEEKDRRLLVFVETDGCFVDGVSAATGCTVGHRTLRVMDYGRVAMTAINVNTLAALRIAPNRGVRELAARYAPPDESRGYYQQLAGYRSMPDDELFAVQSVSLNLDLAALLGQRGMRVDCVGCGEEVLNGREVSTPSGPLCPACHEPSLRYYLEACCSTQPVAPQVAKGRR